MSTKPQPTDIRSRPALHAYRERIGATEKTFRRLVIEEEDAGAYMGGRRTVATIHIDSDGTIKCDDAHAPTADEAKAIKIEVAATPFPKSINARKGQLPPQLKAIDKDHYCEFLDSTGKEVLLIQWRRDGEKPDLPFTYWSDGKWQMMEPDGLLPLYGLERLKDAACVFLHEGAKGARDVQAMIEEGSEHPWRDDLRGAVHLGWPGGATNASRVDWEPIKKLAPHVRVILVCDHDQVGVDAATTISKILRRQMSAIMFDDRFPAGFDLADPWPKLDEWWRKGCYVGPKLDDCLVSATWATESIQSGEKGRPMFKVRKEFAAEWSWVEDPPVYVHHKQTNRLRMEAIFNRAIRPFSDAEDTARLLLRYASSKCDGVAYAPGRNPGIISVEGQRLVNCYRPSSIKAIKGDPAPFVEFIEHLVPDERDRHESLRWCATLVARPEIRMSYGVLLISQVQGVGKGTLGEAILTPLVGEWNVSVPDEQQVTESAFNSWLAHKRLAVVHEIYAGHSSKAYNRLKSVITDKLVSVNEKYMPAYTLENFIHVFACSNSMRALHLDDDDRRWLVPRITDENQPADYWRAFHEWLADDGLGIIRWWMEDFLNTNEPVRRGEHAPTTSAKEEMIEEGRSDGAQIAFDLAQHVRAINTKIILAVEDVRDLVASERQIGRGDRTMEKSLTLRKALLAAGLKEPKREAGKRQERFQISPARKSHIVANFEIDANADWPSLKQFYADLEAIGAMLKM